MQQLIHKPTSEQPSNKPDVLDLLERTAEDEPVVIEGGLGDEADASLQIEIDGRPDPGEVAAIAAAVAHAVTDGDDGDEASDPKPADPWRVAGRFAMTTGRRAPRPAVAYADGWKMAARTPCSW